MRRRRGFLERTTEHLLTITEHSLFAEEIAQRDAFLQVQDPRVKVAGFLLLIVAAALSRSLAVIGALFAAAIVLAVVSQVPVGGLVRRAWAGVLVFTGLIALPAICLTPGRPVARVFGLTVTAAGLRIAALLVARAETTVTFALLLVLTTLWPHVLYALRSLRVPASLVAILGMTYRYLFVLLRTARDMMEARRSREVGPMPPAMRRHVATSSAGVLLGKTLHLADDVYLAMLSRGFRGDVRLLDPPRMRGRDWMVLLSFIAVAAAAVWSGR